MYVDCRPFVQEIRYRRLQEYLWLSLISLLLLKQKTLSQAPSPISRISMWWGKKCGSHTKNYCYLFK